MQAVAVRTVSSAPIQIQQDTQNNFLKPHKPDRFIKQSIPDHFGAGPWELIQAFINMPPCCRARMLSEAAQAVGPWAVSGTSAAILARHKIGKVLQQGKTTLSRLCHGAPKAEK